MDTNRWLDDINIEDIIPTIVLRVAQSAKVEKTHRSTGLQGYEYLFELLQSSPKRIYDVLQMQRATFCKLCNWLEVNTPLKASRYISIQEQVAMFFGLSITQHQIVKLWSGFSIQGRLLVSIYLYRYIL
jgi:hypothetical protein